MLEFNACRHDCELPGGFGAMAIAIVLRTAMCQNELSALHEESPGISENSQLQDDLGIRPGG
jgi:hypothetical protein